MFPVMKAPSTERRVMYLNSLEEKDFFVFKNVQIFALLFKLVLVIFFWCQLISRNFQVTKVNFLHAFFFCCCWAKDENLKCHMLSFLADFEPLLIPINVSQMSVSKNLCSHAHSSYKRSNYLIKHHFIV